MPRLYNSRRLAFPDDRQQHFDNTFLNVHTHSCRNLAIFNSDWSDSDQEDANGRRWMKRSSRVGWHDCVRVWHVMEPRVNDFQAPAPSEAMLLEKTAISELRRLLSISTVLVFVESREDVARWVPYAPSPLDVTTTWLWQAPLPFVSKATADLQSSPYRRDPLLTESNQA